jgi:hypothetical protein
MLLVNFSLKDLTIQRLPLKNQKGTSLRRGLIPHIENMILMMINVVLYVEKSIFTLINFWTTSIFLDILFGTTWI